MEHADVVVVGGGPAGAACAAAVRRARPDADVLVLDRADFPRDKVCGDGIAPEALDVLAGLGIDVPALTAGFPAVPRLRLQSPGGTTVERALHRPSLVVPRAVLDGRLLAQVLATGVRFRRHTVRQVTAHPTHVEVDGVVRAGVLVGADGAESVVRRALGLAPNPPDRLAIAIRGYAPVLPGLDGVQVVTTTDQRWPAYAWSFPIGDGRANVGYGELVSGGVTRTELIAGLHRMLPGVQPEGLRAHRLPLSTGQPRLPGGRVLLAGDAQSLINPLTGEGIFYAVLSGALAGAAADHGPRAGEVHRRLLRRRLGGHLRASAMTSQLSRWPVLMDAAVRAAQADQRVFDDVVALGLADGRLTARTLAATARRLR
ncbi:geranylgeranyl reductase family protein [Modestobacter sp. VKM Ac-2979]|uniref:NAD(P)/FAD-dependent oxidoreductase n=1 Tax=unclassified Modestobacter TaxID=2643866 RepID=UPI0022ABA09C|nr:MULTISPECIES: geranylgeranyl reductase family protein [unclassified Modestobacter]MCZ2813355.1 geranylgeranyl reductase family protein [Modestobacter sp. VKM Ac-2979]MCZ2842453.1 geranylgeranyl reductase family protein [Modestobacter sp. VKM Ac-2980]